MVKNVTIKQSMLQSGNIIISFEWMLCLALKRTGCWACERKLSSFSTDSPGQLEVFGHDGDPLGVDGPEMVVLQIVIRNLLITAPVRAFRNCFKCRYFTTQERGIGYSFQLAITAPLYSITGYCIATAQSCLMWSRFHRWDILPSNPYWNQKITLHGGMRKTDFWQWF